MKKIFIAVLLVLFTTSLVYAGSFDWDLFLNSLSKQKQQQERYNQYIYQQEYQKQVMVFQTLMQTGNYEIAKDNEPVDINLSLLGIRLKRTDSSANGE